MATLITDIDGFSFGGSLLNQLQLIEKTETQSPSTAGCSLDGGKALSSYLFTGPQSGADVRSGIVEILGSVPSVAMPTSTGAINRQNPIAHPIFTYWYAESIANIKDVGRFTVQQADDPLDPLTPTVGAYPLYNQYEYQVQFGPRPYAVVD